MDPSRPPHQNKPTTDDARNLQWLLFTLETGLFNMHDDEKHFSHRHLNKSLVSVLPPEVARCCCFFSRTPFHCFWEESLLTVKGSLTDQQAQCEHALFLFLFGANLLPFLIFLSDASAVLSWSFYWTVNLYFSENAFDCQTFWPVWVRHVKLNISLIMFQVN